MSQRSLLPTLFRDAADAAYGFAHEWERAAAWWREWTQDRLAVERLDDGSPYWRRRRAVLHLELNSLRRLKPAPAAAAVEPIKLSRIPRATLDRHLGRAYYEEWLEDEDNQRKVGMR